MIRLSTIDRILSVVDRADFGVILHFRRSPSIQALRAGSRSARTLYPVTASRIAGAEWKPSATPDDGVAVSPSSDHGHEAEAFLNRPFDPREETPIQQLIVADKLLVTRAHHAALDGFSMGLWLQHQLRIAAGLEEPAVTPGADLAMKLRRCSTHARDRSPRSPLLWSRSATGEFGKRWMTIELPGSVSADRLAAATLRSITQWNRAHGVSSRGLTLWMPVNIRERGCRAFGNGTSRIRLQLSGEVDVRTAVRRSLRSGEWTVPRDFLLMRLPCVLSNPILWLYLHRPWADMGSVVFSCIEDWPGRDDTAFAAVEKIELVGQLHRRHPLAINAISHRGRTSVTFTYDASRLSVEDVSALASELAREVETVDAVKRVEANKTGRARPLRPTLRAVFNDSLRGCVGAFIHGFGAVCSVIHRLRVASFAHMQQRLRRRLHVEPDTPVLPYGAAVEEEICRVASQSVGTRWAETSGSTSRPKRILYTPKRIRQTSWTFVDMFARAFRACCSGYRSSLYVFRPFDEDHSLTSLLVDEGRAPSYIATLQAPYRIESQPAMRALAERYGPTAVRLWILAISNPGVLYSTNPSTLSLFLEQVDSDWERSRKLVADFRRDPSMFDPAVRVLAARLESRGSAERLEAIASSDEALPLSAWAPAVHTVICWTGGYVKPFIDRLKTRLTPDRYRLVPMYSMSTETIETITHFERDDVAFLPLARGVFYEFIEEGMADSPENLRAAHELESGRTYTMVVSDAYGLRRYQTEDVFLCAAMVAGAPDLRFVRRRNLEYSFTGEKLSAVHLQSVFTRLRSEGRLVPESAFLAGVPSLPGGNELPHYKIALVSSESSEAEQDDVIARQCDRMIQEENDEYRRKRETGRLGPAQVLRISIRGFAARMSGSSGAADGQFKLLPLYRRLWEELPGQ